MIKGSPNLLIVWPGWGVGSSHNTICWNMAIFFTSRLKIGRPKDGSPAKSLPTHRILEGHVTGIPRKIEKKTITHLPCLDMKGCICQLAKWQTHPFISKETINISFLGRRPKNSNGSPLFFLFLFCFCQRNVMPENKTYRPNVG